MSLKRWNGFELKTLLSEESKRIKICMGSRISLVFSDTLASSALAADAINHHASSATLQCNLIAPHLTMARRFRRVDSKALDIDLNALLAPLRGSISIISSRKSAPLVTI